MSRRWPLWKRITLIYALPLAIFGMITGVAYPEWRNRQISANQRSASTALKTLSTAEADYRANDRDGNKINDFWTADLSELYRLGLIQRQLATADVRPRARIVPQPIPFSGYFFEALTADASESPPEPYCKNTDGKSGAVHHLHKFGFVAYPAEPGVTGNWIYIVNENNSVWSIPAVGNTVPQHWPSDSEAMRWNRCSGG
jgi:hypothetical protein